MTKILIDEAAVKLALEALDTTGSDYGSRAWEREKEAITALKEMAEQPAQQQDIDWKDQYEKQKRRADMWVAKYEADIGPLEKAGPVAAQQEPVAWLHPTNATCVTTDPNAYAKGVPLYTTPQPAQQEPFGYFKAEPFGWTDCAETDEGAVALYTSPQPAQQEPVAWRTFDGEGGYEYRSYEMNEQYAQEWEQRNPKHKGWVEPLYTFPPAQRTWVGLTDAEKRNVCRVGPVHAPDGFVTRNPLEYRNELQGVALMAVRQAEDKLKEKNNG